MWKGDVASHIKFIATFSHQRGARSLLFHPHRRIGVIQRRLACVGLHSGPIKTAPWPAFLVWTCEIKQVTQENFSRPKPSLETDEETPSRDRCLRGLLPMLEDCSVRRCPAQVVLHRLPKGPLLGLSHFHGSWHASVLWSGVRTAQFTELELRV